MLKVCDIYLEQMAKYRMRKWISLFESDLRLKDYITVTVGDENADFWMIRRGSLETVGQPTREFNPQHLSITVTDTDRILPDYLFYAMTHMWMQGAFKGMASGVTNLVNIRVSDIENLKFS